MIQPATRAGAVFASTLACLALLGCSSDAEEPDAATTLHEVELPGSPSPHVALADTGAGVMVVLGDQLVFVPPTGPAVVVHRAERLHGALAVDDAHVYFATQKKGRESFAQPRGNVGPEPTPDGQIYRVSKAPPFTPEPLAPVGILTGRLALDAGHLFACESPGLNGEGGLLDLPLTAPASAKHHRMRFNEYCRGVAADGERLFLAVDRSFKTDIVDGRPVAYEKGVVLASVPRSADPPWAAGAGPGTLVATEVKSVRDFFVRGGEVTLVADDVALGFTRDGKRAGEFRWGTYGLAAPLGDAGWVWSKDSSAGKDSGRVCTGGRLYAGGSASAGREVTQAVCYAKAFATTATDLLWVDAAYITPGGAGDTTRYRVKRVARPAP